MDTISNTEKKTDKQESNETKKSSRKNDESSKKTEKEQDGREGFSNPIEFILTALGLSVGLGNIWRFPTRAYDNGGSAFLIPYLTCAILFGLPAVYLEMVAGQYQGTSPPIVFWRIMPFLEGIGWMSAMVSATIAIYYIVIISWVLIYIFNLCRGHLDIWNKCDNPWNNPTNCIDMLAQKQCANATIPSIFINGSCVFANKSITYTSATEQYLMSNVIRRSAGGFLDFGAINWPVFISMTICWLMTGLVIWRGMRVMGKISYVTTLLPYFLITVLFIRGITLDGASTGLYYFFLDPDFSKILSMKTWTEALKQLCFSLSVGHGGLMSMASYNRKNSNCFINAVILITGDTLMSLIGGAAVFSTLGFLAKQRNVEVSQVVESGLSLSFVVYPEAFTQMPVPVLWAILFFFMLFLLGLSTEIALTEVFCTCLYDQHPKLRNYKWLVVIIWCSLLYSLGLCFSFEAGFYWFEMFDEYAAGFASVFTVTLEIIVIMYCYGMRNFKLDIVTMIGPARNVFTGFFGAQSPFFLVDWLVISPIFGVILVVLSFLRDYPYQGDAQKYPVIFDILGWILAFLPIFMFPIFAVKNYLWFKKNGYPLKGLFMLQKPHVSYQRIVGKNKKKKKNIDTEREESDRKIPEFEPWGEVAFSGMTMVGEARFEEVDDSTGATTVLMPYVSRAPPE